MEPGVGLVRAEQREQPRLGGRKFYYLIKPELKKAGVKMGGSSVWS